jgi:integrase
MALTDLQCRKTRSGAKLTKLSDMGGLQFWVYPNGTKAWRFAYRFSGKQKLLALGKYPATTLLQARMGRDEAKLLLDEGKDPSQVKKLARLENEFPGDSFEIVAKEYLDKLRREGRAEATMTKLEWLLEFALPVLGPLSVSAIRPIEVLAVLRTVEKRGRYDSARRLRSTIGAVCRYAVATARAQVDPTAPLLGALTAPTVTPRAAVTDPKAFGGLLRAIDGYSGQKTTQAALKLMALLFPRPGELRAAQWPEFNLEEAVWTIPAERTKMRRAHRVPLASQAVDILRELHKITGGGLLVVPGIRTARKPMSENTLNAALRSLGYPQEEATAHGFRASASTLLNESGLWSADAIERQLAHVENNDVRRVYARGEHWDERVKMMGWWASRIDQLKSVGTAVQIDRTLP